MGILYIHFQFAQIGHDDIAAFHFADYPDQFIAQFFDQTRIFQDRFDLAQNDVFRVGNADETGSAGAKAT